MYFTLHKTKVYLNNEVIKLRIYFNSHMQIIGQIMGIIQK